MTANLVDGQSQLADLGWDAARDRELSELGMAAPAVGRVSRIDRGLCTVLMPGAHRVSYQGLRVATGDWVVVSPGDGGSEIPRVAAILPRRSAFSRRRAGSGNEEQVVAANVDTVLLMQALDRTINLHSLQRYLTLAWDSGAEPVVVLSKSDCRPPAEVAEAVRVAATVAGSVPVRAISTKTGEGVAELRHRCLRPGRTLAMVGPSGAGKSSLVNAILGEAAMATNAVRRDGKGRHTTTHRELVVVPGQGVLLDTPGMRAVGLWVQTDGLEIAFSDLELLATGCRFHDCSHSSEPGCCVAAAVAAGTIAADRLESWRRLQLEQLTVAARHADRALPSRHRRRVAPRGPRRRS